MKKLIVNLLMFLLMGVLLTNCSQTVVSTGVSVDVPMNETLQIYEYTHIKEYSGATIDRLELFMGNMQELNYEEIAKSEDRIYGKNFFTKMIYGSAMEVHFNTMIKFKDSSYKLIINNFRIKDVRYGTVAVETLGKSSQKKWMNFISNQLPLVIANLERENTDEW